MRMPGGKALQKTMALGLAVALMGFAMVGCVTASPNSGSSAAPSSLQSMSSSTSASSSSKTPVSSQQAAQNTPRQTQALAGADFAVFRDGQMALEPQTLAFARFSFLSNAAINGLDPYAITTRRGLKIGEEPKKVEEMYTGLPVDVVTTGPEGTLSTAYENYEAFLQTKAAKENHHATYQLYLIEGKPEADAAQIQNVLAANAYSPVYGVLRYDLDFDIQAGEIADITLTVSNLTPYFLGYIQPEVLLDNELCSITATAISNQNGNLCLGLGIQNKTGQAAVAVCTTAVVNGKMPRQLGVLNQPLAPGAYAETLLTIPIDAVRAAGVDMVNTMGFTLQLQTAEGEVLFDSGSLTVPVINPVASATPASNGVTP